MVVSLYFTVCGLASAKTELFPSNQNLSHKMQSVRINERSIMKHPQNSFHCHFYVVFWRAAAESSTDTIPMSSKALPQLVEEQCEHEVMTQRKVEEEKEWQLFPIWWVSLAFHTLHQLPIASASTNAPFFVEVTHKDPFLSSPSSLSSSSQPWTCMNAPQGQHKQGEKQGWDTEWAGRWWGPRRRNQLSQNRESGPETPGTKSLCKLTWGCDRLNGVLLYSYNCKQLRR